MKAISIGGQINVIALFLLWLFLVVPWENSNRYEIFCEKPLGRKRVQTKTNRVIVCKCGHDRLKQNYSK